jgi:hypothetical protein
MESALKSANMFSQRLHPQANTVMLKQASTINQKVLSLARQSAL